MSVGPIICVIDDDHSVRRALSRLLGSYGLDVQVFASAAEFLSSSTPGIACLIVDVHLERTSGLDLVARLGASDTVPPMIVMTAQDEDEIRERAHAHRAAFVRKPFESAALLEAIGHAIGRDFRDE